MIPKSKMFSNFFPNDGGDEVLEVKHLGRSLPKFQITASLPQCNKSSNKPFPNFKVKLNDLN